MISVIRKFQTYSVHVRGQLQNGGKNARVDAREPAGFALLLGAAADHEESRRVEELARR